MRRYENILTLFDADDLIGTLMSATGADEFTARFMVALDRGETESDAEYLHPPGKDDLMFPELSSARLLGVASTPGSVSHPADGGTVLIKLSSAHVGAEIMWQTDIDRRTPGWRGVPTTS